MSLLCEFFGLLIEITSWQFLLSLSFLIFKIAELCIYLYDDVDVTLSIVCLSKENLTN